MNHKRFLLTYPHRGNVIHKSKSLKKAVKKCYNEFKNINDINEGLFAVTDLDDNIEYKFKIKNNKIYHMKKNNHKQQGGNDDGKKTAPTPAIISVPTSKPVVAPIITPVVTGTYISTQPEKEELDEVLDNIGNTLDDDEAHGHPSVQPPVQVPVPVPVPGLNESDVRRIVTGNIGTLNTRMDDMRTDFSKLNSTIEPLNGRINEINSRLDELLKQKKEIHTPAPKPAPKPVSPVCPPKKKQEGPCSDKFQLIRLGLSGHQDSPNIAYNCESPISSIATIKYSKELRDKCKCQSCESEQCIIL